MPIRTIASGCAGIVAFDAVGATAAEVLDFDYAVLTPYLPRCLCLARRYRRADVGVHSSRHRLRCGGRADAPRPFATVLARQT
jgi:hypothetical protein